MCVILYFPEWKLGRSRGDRFVMPGVNIGEATALHISTHVAWHGLAASLMTPRVWNEIGGG